MDVRFIAKRLTPRAHAAILQRMQERNRLQLLMEALDQSIERVIEQDTGVNLDRQNWTLNLEEARIERYKELPDGQ